MTFKFSPQILHVTGSEVEVSLPVSGITIAFHCRAGLSPTPENLEQTSCMQNKCVLWEPMHISRGVWLSARNAGASAIAQYRRESTEKNRKWSMPFQLSFRFQ